MSMQLTCRVGAKAVMTVIILSSVVNCFAAFGKLPTPAVARMVGTGHVVAGPNVGLSINPAASLRPETGLLGTTFNASHNLTVTAPKISMGQIVSAADVEQHLNTIGDIENWKRYWYIDYINPVFALSSDNTNSVWMRFSKTSKEIPLGESMITVANMHQTNYAKRDTLERMGYSEILSGEKSTAFNPYLDDQWVEGKMLITVTKGGRIYHLTENFQDWWDFAQDFVTAMEEDLAVTGPKEDVEYQKAQGDIRKKLQTGNLSLAEVENLNREWDSRGASHTFRVKLFETRRQQIKAYRDFFGALARANEKYKQLLKEKIGSAGLILPTSVSGLKGDPDFDGSGTKQK